jgi:dTMP kinase
VTVKDEVLDDDRVEPGIFICFEGIDGAGKTSTAEKLTERLRAEGRRVEFFGHNHASAAIPFVNAQLQNLQAIQRQALNSPFTQVCELHWVLLRASYYAMVAEHVVMPAIRAGKDVITDGWFYKFAARIASNGSLELGNILAYIREVCAPDLVVLLDVDPQVAAGRKEGFNAGELGPNNLNSTRPKEAFIGYQSLVREQLRTMAISSGWVTVNTSDVLIDVTVGHIMGLYAQIRGRSGLKIESGMATMGN